MSWREMLNQIQQEKKQQSVEKSVRYIAELQAISPRSQDGTKEKSPSLKKEPTTRFKVARWDGTLLVDIKSSDELSDFFIVPKISDLSPREAEPLPMFITNGKQARLPYFIAKNVVDKIIDDRPLPEHRNIPFDITYRENQEKIINECLSQLNYHEGIFLNAPPATGKTVLSIIIALKQNMFPVIVLANKNKLLEQYAKELSIFAPKATWALLGDDTVTKHTKEKINPNNVAFEEADFQLVSVQTLIRRKSILRAGFLISDEAHETSSPDLFSKAVYKIRFRRSMAMTATDMRRDQLDLVFKGLLGMYTVKATSERMPAKAFFIKTKSGMAESWQEDCIKSYFTAEGRTVKYDIQKMRTALVCDEVWENKCLRIINFLYHEAKRNIIVFVPPVNALCRILYDKLEGMDKGLYIGKLNGEKRLALSSRIVVTHEKNIKAGENLPTKDCIFFTYPPSQYGMEQITGRLERIFEGKKQPYIIIPSDPNNAVLSSMAEGCNKYFYKKGQRHGTCTWDGESSSLSKILNFMLDNQPR